MNCHCGLPLHYATPELEQVVEMMIGAAGGDQYVTITVEGRSWRVQRHYIALHGLKAEELPTLGFSEVFVCPKCRRWSANPNDIAHRYCGMCHDFF